MSDELVFFFALQYLWVGIAFRGLAVLAITVYKFLILHFHYNVSIHEFVWRRTMVQLDATTQNLYITIKRTNPNKIVLNSELIVWEIKLIAFPSSAEIITTNPNVF